MVKMDRAFIEQMQAIQECPLNSYEQECLAKYVKSNSFAIKQRLQRKHFISTYGDPQFSAREILNHVEIIQKFLLNSGYSFSLSCFTFERGNRKYYALIDDDYFRGKPQLLVDLANRIYDKE